MDVSLKIKEQNRLSKRALLYDAFGKIRLIAGIDCSYFNDRIIGGAVVLNFDSLEPIEKDNAILKPDFPYIPGLLAYRESKAMIQAYKKLKSDVDIIMIDGFGINHPRRCGIATHIGIKLDRPTIGVGKSFLCGEIRGDTIYQSGEATGKIIFQTGYQKPVYVSPGHKISLDTSVEIVEKCTAGNRLPEPARLAHEYVTELKRKIVAKR